MRIITYTSVGDETPPDGAGSIARIRCPMVGAKGKMGEAWHPVIIYGHDEAEAREKAQAWWDAEIAKELARKATAARLADSRQAKKATAQ